MKGEAAIMIPKRANFTLEEQLLSTHPRDPENKRYLTPLDARGAHNAMERALRARAIHRGNKRNDIH